MSTPGSYFTGTVLVAFPPLLQNPWQKEFSGALLPLQLEGDMDHGAEGLRDCEAIGHTVSAVRIQ